MLTTLKKYTVEHLVDVYFYLHWNFRL